MATTKDPSPQKRERLHQTVEEAVKVQHTTEACWASAVTAPLPARL